MIEQVLNYSVIQQVSLAILVVSLLIQAVYYFFYFLKPALWKQKEVSNNTPPISVIICAKNEEENLRKNLPVICEQKYKDFEVIVVNDCSQDDTEILLGELELKYKNLRHTTIEPDRKFMHSKKLAVSIGIKSAKCDNLVFTDADCYPVSNNWLSEIAKSYTSDKSIVLGYGGYEKQKGLLNLMICFETLFIAMQYIGKAINGRAYMGIGRNMSYKKTLFYGGKGFKSHIYLQSGDDDLFINEHSTKDNTTIQISQDSITRSEPVNKFSQWIKQKRRHLTTAKYYRAADKFYLITENLSRFLFYTTAILSFILVPEIVFTITIISIRLIFQLIIFKLNMNKLNEKGFLLLVPIFDIFMPVLYLCLIFVNKLNRKNSKWR